MLNNNELYYDFCLEQIQIEQSVFESMLTFDYNALLEGSEPLEESVKDIAGNIKKAIETLIDKFIGFLNKIGLAIDTKIDDAIKKQLNELAKKTKEKVKSTGASLEYSKEFPIFGEENVDELSSYVEKMLVILNIIEKYAARISEGNITETELGKIKENVPTEKIYQYITNNEAKDAKSFSAKVADLLFGNIEKKNVTLTKDDIDEIADMMTDTDSILFKRGVKEGLSKKIKKLKDIKKQVSKIKPTGDNGTLISQAISELRSFISSAITVFTAMTNTIINMDLAHINASRAIMNAYLSGKKPKNKGKEEQPANESSIFESDEDIDDDDIEDVDNVEVEEKCKKETCKNVKEMFDSEDVEQEVEEKCEDKEDCKDKDKEVEEKCKKETCKSVKEMFGSEEEEEVEESFLDIDDIELI